VVTLDALRADPNPLEPHYARFRVSDRLLLSGHSHQAWPDCAELGAADAFADAADHVDEKWGAVFAKAARVRQGFAAWMGCDPEELTLEASTHALVYRLLTALPLRDRPRVVTTDSEFYSLRRQLDRLAEDGLEVVRVPAWPPETVGERLAAQTDDRTALVAVSAVFFDTGWIAGSLGAAADAASHHGAALLVDAYHALGVLPLPLRALGLSGAYVTGGGYKYLQLGEGNCFLRRPAGCRLRPAFTGWFAEFGELTADKVPGQVPYAEGPARFAGATYDPVSHYRAARVFDFFDAQGLAPALLRALSQHQVGRLASGFDALGIDPAVIRRDERVPVSGLGGFLSLVTPRAGELRERLRERGMRVDHRGDRLRLGPAPYLSDRRLDQALALLGDAVRDLG
jgi:selenocysteine lyase/cysteine desulfurase